MYDSMDAANRRSRRRWVSQSLEVSYDPGSRHFYVDVDAKWLRGRSMQPTAPGGCSVTLRKD